MTKIEELRNALEKEFGDSIVVSCGNAVKIGCEISPGERDNSDILVYINNVFQIAVIWDIKARRILDKKILNFSLNDKWESVLKDEELTRAVYKKVGNSGATYEKVLVMKVGVLEKEYQMLFEHLQPNPDDKTYPDDCVDGKQLSNTMRKRYSIERWERDYKFRRKVLNRYGQRCAICRCYEEKILQAAHIVAVDAGGSDDEENGICLCANHHLMYDNHIIEINFDDFSLVKVDETVKCMSWYIEFIEKYKGKLIQV